MLDKFSTKHCDVTPAVLSREYVTYLEKKKLSELVWSRELFCSIILLSCQEEG